MGGGGRGVCEAELGVVGGVVWTRLGGGGGTFGTFSGGIVVVDAGVAGVLELVGAEVTGPTGTGVFTGV